MTDSPAYWEKHWDQFSDATALNPGNAFRRRTIYGLLARSGLNADSCLLDVGCGSGDFLAEISRHFPGLSLAGIDHSQIGLDVTASKFPEATLKQVDLESEQSDASNLDTWASHAVCSEVLEHMHDPVLALRNISNFIKPGGILVVTVPGGPKSAFDLSIGHLRHYTPGLIRQDLEAAGFTVDLATGAGFPMFNLYRLVVLLRGKQLARDIGGTPSLLARTAMACFRLLLYITIPRSPWGWQTVALARKTTP
jgi:SAM-dependent methyltransferase